MKKLKCLFGLHYWFWETIELKIGESCLTWNNLYLKVCVRCGKVKAQVRGDDDRGVFKATTHGQVHKYQKTQKEARGFDKCD